MGLDYLLDDAAVGRVDGAVVDCLLEHEIEQIRVVSLFVTQQTILSLSDRDLILFDHNLGLIDAAKLVYLALAGAENATSLHRVLVVEDLQHPLVPLALG